MHLNKDIKKKPLHPLLLKLVCGYVEWLNNLQFCVRYMYSNGMIFFRV
jgi:hypothetical protein